MMQILFFNVVATEICLKFVQSEKEKEQNYVAFSF